MFTVQLLRVLRLSEVLLPAELHDLSTFPVEELESFFVAPWSDPSLYFAVVQLFGFWSKVLKFSQFSLAIAFHSCSKSTRSPEPP